MRSSTSSRKEGEKIQLHKATKIIIDCDPGGDDAQALILAMHLAKKHDIKILGITTVAGNATLENVIYNTQMILNVCQEPSIPIFKGLEPRKKGEE